MIFCIRASATGTLFPILPGYGGRQPAAAFSGEPHRRGGDSESTATINSELVDGRHRGRPGR